MVIIKSNLKIPWFMSRYLKTIVIGFLSMLSCQLFGQFSDEGYTLVTRDLESWTSLNLRFKYSPKINFGLEHGFRLNENASKLDQYLTEFHFKWKPIENLSFGSGFRYIYDRGGNDLFDHDFRWNLDGQLKHQLDRFDFSYRLRFQTRNEIGQSRAEGDVAKNYLRLKTSIAYNIRKWKFDPVFSTEIFRDLTRGNSSFDRIRFTLATEYNMKKFGVLEFFYRFDRELGMLYPKSTYILGVGYQFTIKNKNYE